MHIYPLIRAVGVAAACSLVSPSGAARADTDLRGVPVGPKGPPIALAAPKNLAAAVELVEKATGVKGEKLPVGDVSLADGRSFAVEPHLAERLLEGSHATFKKAGLYLFRYERGFGMAGDKDQIGLLGTTDANVVIRLVGTARGAPRPHPGAGRHLARRAREGRAVRPVGGRGRLRGRPLRTLAERSAGGREALRRVRAGPRRRAREHARPARDGDPDQPDPLPHLVIAASAASCFFSTLPIAFRGSASTRCTSRGRLCGASSRATWSASSSAAGRVARRRDDERHDPLAEILVRRSRPPPPRAPAGARAAPPRPRPRRPCSRRS